ncbi:MAG: SDR family NAD(P)-dependent oxidoreductase [Bryobacteraceae bacterium]
MNLEGKVCLVTGGSRGLGAATALALASAGANVAFAARHDDEAAAAVRCAVEAAGRRCHFVMSDLRSAAGVTVCVDETREVLGDPLVVVHCAGGPCPGTVLEVSTDDWYEAFDLHVHAAFHLCRATIPAMQTHKEGAIVLVSSVAGLRGCPGAVAYGVVKGALPQFCRSMARDFASSNIRVNCVAPGIIRTRFHDRLTAEQVRNNVDNRIPLHREGTPEEVADVILMLVRNEFITGETVTIDGGMTMRIV